MSKKQKIICIVLAVLVAAGAITILLLKNHAEDKNIIELNESVNLNGLQIQSLQEYSGEYVEDGSDENVNSILAAKVKNCTDKALEYAEIELHYGGKLYNLSVSALPAGATALVLEKNRAAFPEKSDDIQANLLSVVYYEEEPELHMDTIETSWTGDSLSVKNTSGTDINSKITVCYKNVEDGEYLGGIAYRASVPNGLAAGETVILSTSHYNPQTSDIIFVSYDK